jgi:hypothetical protein
MNNQNYILQAIEMLIHLDISDEYLADSIQSQAELLSGYDSDLTGSDYDFH